MRLKAEVVRVLINQNNLSQNQLAERIGISKGYLSNCLNGRRGAGRKLLSGILWVFPEESVATLTTERQVAV